MRTLKEKRTVINRLFVAVAVASALATSAHGSVSMRVNSFAPGGLFAPQGLSTLDDFTLDVSGIEGIGGAPDAGGGATLIDFATFTTTAHALNISGPNPGVPSVGDTYVVNVLGVATSLNNDSLGIRFGSGLNAGWQFSFSATVPVSVGAVGPGGFTFSHLGGGSLSWYVDGPAGGITSAAPGSGEGSYTDGTNIATFVSQPGLGGAVNTSTLDGSDDATYSLTSALAGVLKDSSGTDLSTGTLFSLVDSNFDLDPLGLGTWTAGGVSPWPTASPTGAVNTSFNEFFASEDGSLRLAIPEPTTTAIWAGLMGIGLVFGTNRRRVR